MTGALSKSMKLEANPAPKKLNLVDLLIFIDDKQNHKSAIALSCVPSNIAIRPYLIIGNKVNKIADVVKHAVRSLGRKFH